MLEVAALTSGRAVPSSRFRVRQHIGPLRDHGVRVQEYVPMIDKYAAVPGLPVGVPPRLAPQFYAWQGIKLGGRLPGVLGSWAKGITWLERELLPGRFTMEGILRSPLVFDVDDAIWLSSPRAATAAASIAERACLVLAGNRYLADWFAARGADVRVVPTAIDTVRFRPPSMPNVEPTDRFVIGWTGSAASLPYLEALEAPLRRFLSDHPGAELRVVADRPPAFTTLGEERVTFVPWTPSVEATALQGFDVGIMPLPDSDWTRGKCSFKMLQYMACGVPVVVSPVGMNVEVLALGESGFGAGDEAAWVDSLTYLFANRDAASRMGAVGRGVVEGHFSRDRVARQLADVFHGLGERC